jgi:hypothetical protein
MRRAAPQASHFFQLAESRPSTPRPDYALGLALLEKIQGAVETVWEKFKIIYGQNKHICTPFHSSIWPLPCTIWVEPNWTSRHVWTECQEVLSLLDWVFRPPTVTNGPALDAAFPRHNSSIGPSPIELPPDDKNINHNLFIIIFKPSLECQQQLSRPDHRCREGFCAHPKQDYPLRWPKWGEKCTTDVSKRNYLLMRKHCTIGNLMFPIPFSNWSFGLI